MAKAFKPGRFTRQRLQWRRRFRESFPLSSDLASLKKQIVSADTGKNVDAPAGISVHLHEIRQEFCGSSELCCLHAQTILKIRRGIRLGANLDLFYAMWRREAEHLSQGLNSRWLLSALDTYADYGDSVERPTALMIGVFFNAIRIAESERVSVGGISLPSGSRTAVHQPLWDGILTYNLRTGDTLRNMLMRMREVSDQRPTLRLIMETMIARALKANNVLSRAILFNAKASKACGLNAVPDRTAR